MCLRTCGSRENKELKYYIPGLDLARSLYSTGTAFFRLTTGDQDIVLSKKKKKKIDLFNIVTCANTLFVVSLTKLVSSRPRSPMRLPNESLGRDETSFVRLTANNVFSQVTVNFIVNIATEE